jgi:hypothetical protein
MFTVTVAALPASVVKSEANREEFVGSVILTLRFRAKLAPVVVISCGLGMSRDVGSSWA